MKQRVILLFSLLLFAGCAFGQERMVCNERCEIGDGTSSMATKGEVGYAVASRCMRRTTPSNVYAN